MWDPNNRHDLVVESIKASAVRTAIIIEHIDGMLNIYQTMCYNSHNDVDKRRYDILSDRYISDEQLTMAEIAEKQCIDERTAYNDLKTATNSMAKLIFGIDYLKG
jgi:hypothetical protein